MPGEVRLVGQGGVIEVIDAIVGEGGLVSTVEKGEVKYVGIHEDWEHVVGVGSRMDLANGLFSEVNIVGDECFRVESSREKLGVIAAGKRWGHVLY